MSFLKPSQIIFLVGLCTGFVRADDAAFAKVKQTVRDKFRDVPQLSTAELAKWLHDSNREKPLLLDVRTKAEFDVSHLVGASRVDPSANLTDVLPTLPKGRPVVTYCSVGYRSSSLAEKLIKAGVPNVSNLEGSIFQWANENRPIVADGQPAQRVHPYNEKFGKLLDEKKRAQLKSSPFFDFLK